MDNRCFNLKSKNLFYLKCSFLLGDCTLKLRFKNTSKLFLSLCKICYAVNKEK